MKHPWSMSSTVSDPGRIRVLHVITRLDVGGAATNTMVCVERMKALGFESVLAFGWTRDAATVISRLAKNEISYHYLPQMIRQPSPLRDLVVLFQLVRLLRQGKYDVVHTHTSKAGALTRPVACLFRLPVVHTSHGHIFYGYFSPLLTAVFIRIERFLARWTDCIVSLTDGETADCLKHGIGRPAQYRTVPSGVALRGFQSIPESMGKAFRSELQIPAYAKIILSTGRLVPVKGFGILLRSFARVAKSDPSCVLVLVGDGDERVALERLADTLGIAERVRFAGFREDVRPALRAADLFVLASRNEGMGRSLVEAMAVGVPVVATRVGGIPLLVEHKRTGLLVNSGDEEGLAKAIRSLLASEETRVCLGRKASQAVYPEYDEETMVARLASIYRDVLDGRRLSSLRNLAAATRSRIRE